MPWYLWLLLTPIALAGLLWGGTWLLFHFARRGIHRIYIVETARGPREVKVYVAHWLTKIWPTAAVAAKDAIWLKHSGTRDDKGPVTSLDALVHELIHAVIQFPRMGWKALPTYLWQRIVLRRAWATNRIEREAIRLTRNWFAGDRSVLEDLPGRLREHFPHRSTPPVPRPIGY